MKKKNEWIIIFVSVFMIVSLSRSVIDLWERRKIVKEEQERLALVEKKHQELTEKLKMVQAPAFVEKEARERLGMARPGDTVIIMDTKTDNGKESGTLATGSLGHVPYWKRWWQIFF